MNPTATNAKGKNTHTYPAFDYAVAIGTGLVACKGGTFVDFPGQPTRKLMGNLNNGNAWSSYIPNAQNSGNVLTISHGNGEYTCYLHASPYDVNAYRGKSVNQGESFARSGHNGWSTGPHLHFEVWKNGVRIDPGSWLANIKQGENMKPTDKQADALIRALMTEADGFTPHWPSQKDIDFAITNDWAAQMPNYYPGVQRLRDNIKLLTEDRDKNLYPFIETVTKALGLPSSATKEQCVAAIDKLKSGQGTKLSKGSYYVE